MIFPHSVEDGDVDLRGVPLYTVGRLDHAARLLFVDQSAKPILAVNPAGPDGYPVPRLHRPVLTGTLMRLGPLEVLAELRRATPTQDATQAGFWQATPVPTTTPMTSKIRRGLLGRYEVARYLFIDG